MQAAKQGQVGVFPCVWYEYYSMMIGSGNAGDGSDAKEAKDVNVSVKGVAEGRVIVINSV